MFFQEITAAHNQRYFLFVKRKKYNMETVNDTELLNFCLGILRCTRQEIQERCISVRELFKVTKEKTPIWETKQQLLVRICFENNSSFDEKLLEAFPGLNLPKFEKNKLVLTKEPRKVLSVFVGDDRVDTLAKIGCIRNLESVAFSEEQLGEDAEVVVERIRCICPQIRVSFHTEKESETKKEVVQKEKKNVAKWGAVSLKKFTYHPKFFPKGWSEFFEEKKDSISEISSKLKQETKKITPPILGVWKAFQETPRDSVRVVILGQDPYPTPGNAMGLAFSVKKGTKPAASLRNIAEEVEKQGFKLSGSGDLTCWAKQGVLLLNTALTTNEGEREAHVGVWGDFSRDVIRHLNENCKGIVYILWGGAARKFRDIINAKRNLVLECAHPSPLSVEGFRGNNHFVSANEYLKGAGKEPIDWSF
ncbi:uracil-DNA glycosylase [Brazilian marseillevirus]|uniref:uracil-DNA glycosylase n=1 Tax=Brazilian marseillevirus TaxID=1813599 RepID=UPI00078153BB|nr:uracil-DNA glycosylase [Brazilian marseillevirus]AMQ10968.1 uracil-DNA glycosylase [Brazilian marseillevirus]